MGNRAVRGLLRCLLVVGLCGGCARTPPAPGRTSAAEPGGWRLYGEKTSVTSAARLDRAVVFARTPAGGYLI